MGIDFGTKKVGIALTNEGGNMAFPHSVIPNDDQLLAKLEQLIEKEKVGEIIMGHSLDTNGKPNAAQAGVEELMTDLTLAVGLPIHLVPEQYTTQLALRTQGRNAMTDASAAALILNTFLEQQ